MTLRRACRWRISFSSARSQRAEPAKEGKMSNQSNSPVDVGKPDEGLRQYLVEEFVEDYQEGRMTRRDALKRIGGVLGSLVLAENLLAACTPLTQLSSTPSPSAPLASTTPPRAQASPTAQATASPAT